MHFTFGIIKPDAMKKLYYGKILDDIAMAGFKLVELKLVKLTEEKAKNFYSMHEHKPFFAELIAYMCSAPVLCFVLQHESNAVEAFRELMGDTDPAKAKKGTLRAKYGRDLAANAVHGSDSEESFMREWKFFFKEDELLFNK